MKTKLLFLSLLFYNLAGYSQFTLKGIVLDNDGKPNPFAGVGIHGPDNFKIGKWVDTTGCFEFILPQKGTYTFHFNNQGGNNCGESRDTLFLSKDTSLVIALKYPLAFDQPCRAFSNQNNYILNLPTKTHVYEEYKIIQRSSEKLNLPNILNDTVNIILRIWSKPAFEYGGGALYEITETMNKQWTLKIINFTSKLKEYIDQPNFVYVYQSIREKDDTLGDSYYSEQVRTTSIRQINIEKDWFTENGKNYLDQYLNSNDYCLNMSCEDHYIVMDGIMYFVELKNQNNYSFTYYHSPDLTNKYEQIDAFVKIMELLEKRLSDKENSQ
jgi:hypothetical protein